MTPHTAPQAVYSLPASFTPEKQEELFGEIVRLYDLADNVLAAISRDGIPNRSIQLELATPFITQITNSANIISGFYNEVVNKKAEITLELRDTIESAVRNIFVALKELADQAEDRLLPEDKR